MDSRLKHVQVREFLRTLAREQPAGSIVPSERVLSQRFTVARMTVRQAVDSLVADGLLIRYAGKGTFVAPQQSRVPGELLNFTETIRRRGSEPSSRTLVARREQAGPGVARALEITPGDAVIHWKRLRSVDGSPAAVEDTFLNEVLLPGFFAAGPPDSLYEALALRGLRPTWAEDSVSAGLAAPEEAALLEVDAGQPLVHLSRRTLAGSVAIAVSRSVLRTDRHPLTVELSAPR